MIDRLQHELLDKSFPQGIDIGVLKLLLYHLLYVLLGDIFELLPPGMAFVVWVFSALIVLDSVLNAPPLLIVVEVVVYSQMRRFVEVALVVVVIRDGKVDAWLASFNNDLRHTTPALIWSVIILQQEIGPVVMTRPLALTELTLRILRVHLLLVLLSELIKFVLGVLRLLVLSVLLAVSAA